MNASRVAAWIIGAAVCTAWLASAAGVARQGRPARHGARPSDVIQQFDALAADVQAQAGKLRDRLASAPTPRATERNPFRFSEPPVRRRATGAAAASPLATATEVADLREPALELVGIAETKTADGVIRTAMITGGYGELMMVRAGQQILGRYDVAAVGADAVELKDLQTGKGRRLMLR